MIHMSAQRAWTCYWREKLWLNNEEGVPLDAHLTPMGTISVNIGSEPAGAWPLPVMRSAAAPEMADDPLGMRTSHPRIACYATRWIVSAPILHVTLNQHTSKPVYRPENRFWPCPHADIIRQVHPADRAGRIDEKFGGPRDVFTPFAALRMEHSVLTDRLSLGIGKEWKRIPSGLTELL